MSWEPYKLDELRRGFEQTEHILNTGRIRAKEAKDRPAERHFENQLRDLKTSGVSQRNIEILEDYLGQPGMVKYLK